MNAIHLLPVGETAGLELLDDLAADLAGVFHVSCHVRSAPFDAAFAFDKLRGQYYSTAILERLAKSADKEQGSCLLGVTELDLFVPVLTYVFGEAQLAGQCAVVSWHRLRDEFYGLPANTEVLAERLMKEAVHELGHTCGLRHCSDWRCVMASTHAVERLDLKSAAFCAACALTVTGPG